MPSIYTDILLLAVSLVVVLAASVVFTNAVEMLGHRMKLHQGAVGSLLAAVGTAMPETIIPVIAIVAFWGTEQANKIALGAIAGAPFMLATFLPAVLGWAGSGAVWAGRIVVAIGLLAAYGLYVRMTLAGEADGVECNERLLLARLLGDRGLTAQSIAQFVVALGVMIYGAHLFVKYAKNVSETAGISPLVLSLIITPIATELPEKFNSVVWVSQGKDTLAMGNITGAMVFQSCIPVAIGIVGTPWDLMAEGGVTMVSAVLALVSGAIAVIWLRTTSVLNHRALMVGGLLYGVFVAYVLWGR